MSRSPATTLALLPTNQRDAVLADLSAQDIEQIERDWRFWARPNQLPPPGDWTIWLVLAGRGFGKTRTGAEWVRGLVKQGYGRIALVAPTAADIRDVMIDGESGVLSVSCDRDVDMRGNAIGRPTYEPSKRHRLTWGNGAQAFGYSAEEPERLRGPQHDAAWADELCAWKYARDTWDMLQFGLRLGTKPREIITTTPKPIELLKEIVKRRDAIVTRGATRDNLHNLAPKFVEQIVDKYEGTRLGRQELDGEIIDDLPGALWWRALFEADPDRKFVGRVTKAPDLSRVVVAVDPSGTRGQDDDGDSIGIVVAGKGVDGRAYVLADRSCKLSPDGWGRRAVAAYHEFKADRIVAERNFGGAMVEHVIRTVDRKVAYKEVTASRGKIARAEPVSGLYEQNKVSHVGALSALEDQLCMMAGEGYAGEGSPDRADALVWALTELMLGREPRGRVIDTGFY